MNEQLHVENEEIDFFAPAKKEKDDRPIKSSVSVHDRTQVETVFDYKLQRSGALFGPKNQKFAVEAFLFFPHQMGIGELTYSRAQFYEDLRPLLRFKEPRYAFKDFLGGGSQTFKSPLLILREYLQSLESGDFLENAENAQKVDDLIDQVRLFACTFSTYLQKRLNRRYKILKYLSTYHGFQSEMERSQQIGWTLARFEILLMRTHKLLKEWHELLEMAEKNISVFSASRDLAQEMRLADEYCHYRFREGVAVVASILAEFAGAGPWSLQAAGGEIARLQRELRVWVRLLRMSARRYGYLWIEETSDASLQERFVFRRGQLKKRMWQVLYLDMKPRQTLAIRRQLGYMVAAGFAAAWALMVDILIWFKLQYGGVRSIGGLSYFWGYSGLIIVLASVLAYSLKDRIKEIGRARFNRGLFGKLPDFSEKIWARSSAGVVREVGDIQESVDFLKSMEKVPAQVQEIRAGLDPFGMMGREKVVYYRKVIGIHRASLNIFGQQMPAVRDILRFSVRRFLAKLDDPMQEYLTINTKGQVQSLLIPKVYHLDMVLRYSCLDARGRMQSLALDCHRLVLNKEGLIRIERPS